MKYVKLLIVWLAVVGFCVPRQIFAATPQKAPKIYDVALQQGGTLVGYVQAAKGGAKANVPVTIYQGNKKVAVTQTDKNGYFVVRGLQGGVYKLAAANGTAVYRLWAPKTAPPTAFAGAVVVEGQDVVRGQLLGGLFGGLSGILTRPVIIGAAIATAIAVPVAIAASEDEEEAPASP